MSATKLLLTVINLLIHYVHSNNVTVDLGAIALSAAKNVVPPLYKPLQPEDEIATQNAKNHFEWLRQKFPTGVGYLPPLDPYKRLRVDPIQIDKGWLKGQILITHLQVVGAQEFILNSAEVRMQTHTVTANISIPQLVADAYFDAEMDIGILPLFITGNVQVVLTGINFAGSFATKDYPQQVGRSVYQVVSSELEVKADDLVVSLTNLNIDADENSVMDWWGRLKGDIANKVNEAVVVQINEVLMHYSTKEIDDFLLTPSYLN